MSRDRLGDKIFNMFYFNFKEAAIYPAIKWEKKLVFRLAKSLKKICLVLFVVLFLIFIGGLLTGVFAKEGQKSLLGLLIIFLVLGSSCQLTELFLNLKLKKPKLKIGLKEALLSPSKHNLADFLSFDVAKVVFKFLKFSRSKKVSRANSSVLFYFLLTSCPKLTFIFQRALLNITEIKKTLAESLLGPPPDQYLKNKEEDHFKIQKEPTRGALDWSFGIAQRKFEEIILEAFKIAQEKDHQRVEIGDIFIALAKYDLIFKRILSDANLKIEDIENLVWWLENLEEKIEKRKRFWEKENLMKIGTLAKEWAAGYTITLDKFSIDLTEAIKRYSFETIGHKDQIMQVERILSRREINNVLLVGEPGTGRKSIIYEITKKSFFGQSLPEVNFKRVVQLDLPQLLAQLSNMEEAEMILDKIFQEAISAGNIILVIDEFHNYIGQTTQLGVIDISGILSSYLHLPEFQIIAVTNFAGLHQNIEKNPSILSLFEKVEVSEISSQETLMLLENLVIVLEKKYKRFVSYPALREIISLTKRYFPSLPFPEKAMKVLDEVIIFVIQNTKDKIILHGHVAKIITEKTQIPVGEIETKERQILLKLEDLIHQRIINQEEAVSEVSSALRRARAEITVRKAPMGTFLFLGPTGVGKTETAKAITEIYFGSEEKMIRLDMSEFQAVVDIPRLLGSLGQEGLLTTPIRENPFSLVLLDEIEKAHPNILNLFLQVLDEGHLTDGQGRKVDFKNSIIIATSNAGYQFILDALKIKMDWFQVKEKLLDFLFSEGVFRPEFINRFDAVVIFQPLSKENLLDIAELLLQKLKKNLLEKGIEFVITHPLKEKIVKLGYDPKFGAREMKRVIQDKVENVLAQAILKGELINGSRAEIDPENFQLKINP